MCMVKDPEEKRNWKKWQNENLNSIFASIAIVEFNENINSLMKTFVFGCTYVILSTEPIDVWYSFTNTHRLHTFTQSLHKRSFFPEWKTCAYAIICLDGRLFDQSEPKELFESTHLVGQCFDNSLAIFRQHYSSATFWQFSGKNLTKVRHQNQHHAGKT